jgi:hypothetical protein
MGNTLEAYLPAHRRQGDEMKDVYLRAAELIDSSARNYSCDAVYAASRFRSYTQTATYAGLFSPDYHPDFSQVFWGDRWSRNKAERKQCRVLALLFMHWISQGAK